MSDAEQLDQRLSKLLAEHQHYRKLLYNYIGRALSHCSWHVDEDSPSFLRQMDRAEKLVGLLWYIQNHVDQSRYKLDRSAQLMLPMAESFLAFSNNNHGDGSSHHSRNGRAGANGMHPHHHPYQHGQHPPHQQPFDIQAKVAALTDDVRVALRFWQDQSEIARLMEPKVIELERFARERSMDLSRKEATIEEKAGALRIANDQSRKVTEVLEVFLDQWFMRLQLANPSSSLASTGVAVVDHRSRDGGGGGSIGHHPHTPGPS